MLILLLVISAEKDKQERDWPNLIPSFRPHICLIIATDKTKFTYNIGYVDFGCFCTRKQHFSCPSSSIPTHKGRTDWVIHVLLSTRQCAPIWSDTSYFLAQASWRLYGIRQPPTFLCSTSKLLMNNVQLPHVRHGHGHGGHDSHGSHLYLWPTLLNLSNCVFK